MPLSKLLLAVFLFVFGGNLVQWFTASAWTIGTLAQLTALALFVEVCVVLYRNTK